jgi:hypothetical protein
VTWCALGSVLDTAGTGRLGYERAVEFIRDWRKLHEGSVRRMLREGEGLSWHRHERRDGRRELKLIGIARIMVRLEVDHERPPRSVPLEELRSVAGMRRELY